MSEHAERQRRDEQRPADTDRDADHERHEFADELPPADDGTTTRAARRPPTDPEPQCGAERDTDEYREGRGGQRRAGDGDDRSGDDDEDESEGAEQGAGGDNEQNAEHTDSGCTDHRDDRAPRTDHLSRRIQTDAVAATIRREVARRRGGPISGHGTIGGHRGHRRHGTGVRRVARSIVVAAVVVLLVAVHGSVQWVRLHEVPTGPIDGVVRIVDDPRAVRGGVALVVAHESWRYRMVVRGAARGAVVSSRTGDHLYVVGERRALRSLRGRDIADHVAAEIVVRDVTGVTRPAAPVYRMVSQVHGVIDDVTSRLPATDAALLRGLLIGDDGDHPEHLVDAFRAAGMGHLVAVSGQNVALVLAWVAPLIAGRRRSVRLVVIVLVVATFAFVTRLEPSVVRAAVMAIIVRGAATLGRDFGAGRALLATASVLLIIDPFLLRSVGFVLSVAATAGLVWLTPGLSAVLGTGPVARVASATIAAQLAVAPFALWWFGSLPIIAVPANVIAVPIASAIMVIGLPLVLVCGAILGVAQRVGIAEVAASLFVDAALFVVHIPVRAIWWIAVAADKLAPGAGVNVVAWIVAYLVCLAAVLGRRTRVAE